MTRGVLRFVLVYNHLYTGGIETLILRLANWLVEHGHSVHLLLSEKKGELLELLDTRCVVEELGFYRELRILQYRKARCVNEANVFMSFEPSTLWYACFLYHRSGSSAKCHLHGIYHPNDFEHYGNEYSKFLSTDVLPPESLLFMNQAVKTSHEGHVGKSFEASHIWPLPVEVKSVRDTLRSPKKFRIVSIGRLTRFKTYNLFMVDVVQRLVEKGYDVQYDIYGEGTLRNTISELIREKQLEERIFLRGNIPYDQLPEVFESAYAFVGMGTAAIEAAIARVPTIASIVYSKAPLAYGLIHELPGYNCGEIDESLTARDVTELLMNLFNCSEDRYREICNASRAAMIRKYDLQFLMPRLIQIAEDRIGSKQQPAPFVVPVKEVFSRLRHRHIKRLKRVLKSRKASAAHTNL